MNHKIKINNIEVELTEEQIRELHSRLESKGEKYFFPEMNKKYIRLETDGRTTVSNRDSHFDTEVAFRGNAFRTEAQARKEDEKRLALVRMWKWVQENGLYFEPDWNDENSIKYFPVYHYRDKGWTWDDYRYTQQNFLFPHFKTESDCQKFIDNNLSDLNLFV